MADRLADLLRLAVFAGVIIAPAVYPPGSSFQLAFAFAVLVGARHVALPALLDLALCAAVGLGVWASVAGWYGRHPLIELAVHLTTAGLVVAVLYLIAARLQLFPSSNGRSTDHPRSAVVLIATALGLSAGVVWECFEWLVFWLPRTTLGVGLIDTPRGSGHERDGWIADRSRPGPAIRCARTAGTVVVTAGPRGCAAGPVASGSGWCPQG